MRPGIRSASGGFTLIEVLLASIIAGLLFTGAFWSLQQAVDARNDFSNKSTPYVMGPAILDVIAADLANASFYDIKENNAFWGNDAKIFGRPADAISFVTFSRSYAPEEYGPDDDRDSLANEVAYLLREGASGTPFLELWRREDFFVDDHVHADGDFVLLYDKVHSLEIKYISRNPQGEQGVGGSKEKSEDDMLQDGWNSVKERGLPRAVQFTLRIWAKEGEEAVDSAVDAGTANVFAFQRYLTLPQVHMSLDAEQKIANWDGRYNEAKGNKTANKQGAAGLPGQPGPGAQPGAVRPRGRGGRGRGQNPMAPGAQGAGALPPGANPFLQALQGRGGARPPAGGSGPINLGALFGGSR